MLARDRGVGAARKCSARGGGEFTLQLKQIAALRHRFAVLVEHAQVHAQMCIQRRLIETVRRNRNTRGTLQKCREHLRQRARCRWRGSA